jgi:Mg-chelatase subunit ChlD
MARSWKWLAAVALLAAGVSGLHAGEPAPQQKARPKVEVVFCLDTTGSMGGLIDAAKKKIWSISNQIAAGKPTPDLKVGLVAYRDRGDAYVTKVFDLTDDLDAIHGHLMSFRAEGGNDFPEDVNAALLDAVTKITWGKDKKTLKIIFLVGDAPPHMDYKDQKQYPEICQMAVKNDILINTVQCGTDARTRKVWQEICRLAEGSYVQIGADGGPQVAIATPFDNELAKINAEMARSTVFYGGTKMRSAAKGKAKAAGALPPPVAADRAAYSARTGRAATYDLLDAVKRGTVKLETLKKDELPEEMQKLSLTEQKEYLDKLEKRREELNKRVVELDKKRGEFIAKKVAEQNQGRPPDTFDGQVLRILAQQARRNGIEYAVPAGDKKK